MRSSSLFDPSEISEQDAYISEAMRAAIRTEITHTSLVEWAEKTRIIPKGLSPMDGLFSWDVTPYLEEIADCLSETSPVQEIAVMKGARVGFTVGVLENFIGYSIDVAPAPILYVGADKEAAEEVMETRIGPMIAESGLSHKIFAPTSTARARSTGDTKRRKDFAGGRLRAIGPAVGPKLRGNGFSRLLLDEIDAWKNEVGTVGGKTKSEGSTLSNILRRSDEYEETRKILYGGTPLLRSSSIIEPLFLSGDQRRYFVPCKHCGTMQYLKWDGIKYAQDDSGRLVEGSVHYECESCGGHWLNEDKVNFMRTARQGGSAEWRPTAEPRRRGLRSYHLPSFYSPVGFRSWESIVLEWLDVGDDVTKRQTIVNTVFGETWYEVGRAIEYERIMVRREGMDELDPTRWPERALCTTIGADVQKDRIEAEVVAWGEGLESWSLGYHVLHGDTEDPSSPAWQGLKDLIYSEPAGHLVHAVLIDSSYLPDIVYSFCESFLGEGIVLPCAGEELQNPQRRLYVLRPLTGWAIKRADIQTNQLKGQFYRMVSKAKIEGTELPVGYCHFPEEYGEAYFKMLTAEEEVSVVMQNGRTRRVWRKIKGRGRNEALDCRVYALAALNVMKGIYLDETEEPVSWTTFWSWWKDSSLSTL